METLRTPGVMIALLSTVLSASCSGAGESPVTSSPADGGAQATADAGPDEAPDDSRLLFGLMLHIEPQLWRPCQGECPDCGRDAFLSAAHVMDRLASIYESHGAVISMQVGLGYAQSSALWPDVAGGVQDIERRGHGISVHIHYPAGAPGGFRAVACPQPWDEDFLCAPGSGPTQPPQQAPCDDSRPDMTQQQYCTALGRRIDAVDQLASAPAKGLCAATGGAELDTLGCLSSLGIDYVSGLATHAPLMFEQDPECPDTSVGHSSLTALHSYRPVMRAYGDELYAEGMFDEDCSSPLVIVASSHVTGMMNPNQGVSVDDIIANLEQAIRLTDPRKVSSAYMATHLYEFGDQGVSAEEKLAKWDELLSGVDELVEQGKVRYASLGQMHEAYLGWEASRNRLVYPQNANFEADDEVLSNCNAVDGTVDVFELFLGWMAQDGTPLSGDSGRDEAMAHTGQASLRLGGAAETLTALPGLAVITRPVYARLAGPSRVRASVWVNAETGASADVQLWSYTSNDASPPNPAPASKATGATAVATEGSWQQLALEADVTAQAPYLRVALVREGLGTAWFDDVLLEIVP